MSSSGIMALLMMIQNAMISEDPSKWVATAYCSCEKCCGKAYNDPAWNVTASGAQAGPGVVAVNWLPFGTRLIIDGKTYTVKDRGSKKHFGSLTDRKKRVDIWFPSHREALKFGRRTVTVTIVGINK